MKNINVTFGKICIFIGCMIFGIGCWASEMVIAKALCYELYFNNLEAMLSSPWYLAAVTIIAIGFGVFMTRLIVNQIQLWKIGKDS